MFIPSEEGRWIDENFERLARVVHDYDPQFELRWIPPEHRSEPGDRERPYVIWDTYTNNAVLYANELDTPSGILARLFNADNKHGSVLDRLDAHNAAIKALEMKAQLDASEERQDKVAFLIGTKKNYINLGKDKNGKRRLVDDQLRPIL